MRQAMERAHRPGPLLPNTLASRFLMRGVPGVNLLLRVLERGGEPVPGVPGPTIIPGAPGPIARPEGDWRGRVADGAVPISGHGAPLRACVGRSTPLNYCHGEAASSPRPVRLLRQAVAARGAHEALLLHGVPRECLARAPRGFQVTGARMSGEPCNWSEESDATFGEMVPRCDRVGCHAVLELVVRDVLVVERCQHSHHVQHL